MATFKGVFIYRSLLSGPGGVVAEKFGYLKLGSSMFNAGTKIPSVNGKAQTVLAEIQILDPPFTPTNSDTATDEAGNVWNVLAYEVTNGLLTLMVSGAFTKAQVTAVGNGSGGLLPGDPPHGSLNIYKYKTIFAGYRTTVNREWTNSLQGAPPVILTSVFVKVPSASAVNDLETQLSAQAKANGFIINVPTPSGSTFPIQWDATIATESSLEILGLAPGIDPTLYGMDRPS